MFSESQPEYGRKLISGANRQQFDKTILARDRNTLRLQVRAKSKLAIVARSEGSEALCDWFRKGVSEVRAFLLFGLTQRFS